MKLKLFITIIGIFGAFANVANAQSASFLNAQDVLIGKCFNPSANQIDANNPNRLIVGIHSELRRNGCIAATGSYYLRNLSDIMTIDVVAPEGYYISKIKYSMIVTRSIERTGVAVSNNTFIVAGSPLILPGSGTFQVDLSVLPQRLTSVPVSISTFSFVSSTGSLGGGTASLESPVIEAEILPLP